MYSSQLFAREMLGVRVLGGVYIHVSGIDLIRDETGAARVLEDNVRTPSGISYVLRERTAIIRRAETFPAALRRLPDRTGLTIIRWWRRGTLR